MFDLIQPLIQLRRQSDGFEIPNILSNRASQLVPKKQTGKLSPLTLPIFRQRFKTDILGKHDSAQYSSTL